MPCDRNRSKRRSGITTYHKIPEIRLYANIRPFDQKIWFFFFEFSYQLGKGFHKTWFWKPGMNTFIFLLTESTQIDMFLLKQNFSFQPGV